LICDSTDTDIRKALGYGVVLLGIPKNKIPQSEVEKIILLEFIKKTFPKVTRFEINAAFDYAVEEKFETELKLYGSTFSAAFVAGIIKGYLRFKNGVIRNSKAKENVGMNNQQITSSIVSLLGEEGIKQVTEKAVVDEKRRDELRKELSKIPLQNEKELVEFNREWEMSQENNWINYEGKMMNFDEYVNYRLKEELNNK
jgi:hypothetical protein